MSPKIPKTPKELADEYLSVAPPPDPAWEAAVQAWCFYYLTTELYDRRLVRATGGYYTENGAAIPHDMVSSRRHAKEERKALARAAVEDRVTEELMRAAQKYVERWSFEDIWRHVMGDHPCPER